MKSKIKSAIWAALLIIIGITVWTLVIKPNDWGSEPLAKIEKKKVTIIADDGVELSADLYEPKLEGKSENKKYPGVILLSPYGVSRDIYSDIANELCRRHFVVLSVDVRNSGESKSSNDSFVENIANLGIDANTAVYYMQERSNVMQDKIAILGTALTARSALMVKNLNSTIKGVVMVSAIMDSVGYHVLDESSDCPILVLVSIQDPHAGSQALNIYQASGNSLSKIQTYFNAGSGVELWFSQVRSEMMTTIVEWLTKVLLKT